MGVNINWLKENLNEPCVIFDIGCANMNDTIRYKNVFQNSTFYAFECNNKWKSQNLITAKENNINYFHAAVSSDDKRITFYPSDSLNGVDWPLSGSIFSPKNDVLTENWKWERPYTVNAISLNTFCKLHNICPDFIHIDAQGAEYSIFENLKEIYKPKIIWAEISAFSQYATSVTYEDFSLMMRQKGYVEIYKDYDDGLYVMNNNECTPYTKD
jgi:FkbM family methyltransferase